MENILGVPLLTFKQGPVAMGLLAVFAFAFLLFFSSILICVVQLDGGAAAVAAWVCFCVAQLVCIAGQGALNSRTDARYYVSNFLEQLQIGSAVVADGVLSPRGPLEEKILQMRGCSNNQSTEVKAKLLDVETTQYLKDDGDVSNTDYNDL